MKAARPPSLNTPMLLSDVLERPELLLRELLWRWLCGALLSLIGGYDALRIWNASLSALHATGLFGLSTETALDNPSHIVEVFAAVEAILRPQIERAVLGLAPLGLFCWVMAFAVGRAAVLTRFDARLPRRPWMLAGWQGLQTVGDLSVVLVWSTVVKTAHSLLLRKPSPSFKLYSLVILLTTVAAWIAWGQMANKMQAAMALALLESRSAWGAFRRAWHLPDSRLAERATRFRKSARKTQLYILMPAFVISLIPSPFHSYWVLAAWYGLLSLVPLVAADAVRLGVLFTLLREVQAEHIERAAKLPGVSPEQIRL